MEEPGREVVELTALDGELGKVASDGLVGRDGDD